MSIYLDTSALLGILLDEPGGEAIRELLASDTSWFSARHTAVEVRRNLARLLAEDALTAARTLFRADWARTNIVELDSDTCELASVLAESTGLRTLDALHLAAARRVGGSQITIVTSDRRLADAARSIGNPVAGA